MNKFMLGASALALLVAGCDDPQPVATNNYRNEITDRQRLVVEFKTAEVYGLPGDEYQFVVRDTNGAIWYVKSDRGAGAHGGGKTMLFGPVMPLPVKVEDDETAAQRKMRQTAEGIEAVYFNAMTNLNLNK